MGTLDITLYRDDLSTIGSQPVVQSTEIDFPVDNRDLVIVDDVLYTGRTIRAAMNGLFDLGRPKRIRLCVLIDRGHRELPVEATFVGRNVQTSDTEIVEVRLQEIDGEERVDAGRPRSLIRRQHSGGGNLTKGNSAQRLPHLLGIETLTREQITFILDQSKPFQEFQRHPLKKLATLRGKTVALAFFEPPRARASASPPPRPASARTRWLSRPNPRA